MAVKLHSRSFRFTDEVNNILQSYGVADLTLNERFERLVLDCYEKLPEVQKQLKDAEAQRDALKAESLELMRRISDQRAVARQIDELMITCQQSKLRIDRVLERFEQNEV